jgi:hypothetical protein
VERRDNGRSFASRSHGTAKQLSTPARLISTWRAAEQPARPESRLAKLKRLVPIAWHSTSLLETMVSSGQPGMQNVTIKLLSNVQAASRPWKQKVFPKKELPRLPQAGMDTKRVSPVPTSTAAPLPSTREETHVQN